MEGDFSLRGLVFHFQMTCSMIGGGGRLVLKIRVSGAANVNPGHRLAYMIYGPSTECRRSHHGPLLGQCRQLGVDLSIFYIYDPPSKHPTNHTTLEPICQLDPGCRGQSS